MGYQLLTTLNVIEINSIIETSQGTILVGVQDLNGQIYRSTDGTNFTQILIGVDFDRCWSLIQTNTQRIFAGVAFGNGDGDIYYSDDDGLNWSLSLNTTNSGTLDLIYLSNGRILGFFGTSNGNVWYSDNDGISWTQGYSFPNTNWVGAPTQLTSGRVICGGGQIDDGYIWISDDDGLTWTQTIDVDTDAIYSTCQLADGRVLIGTGSTSGVIWISDDDCLTATRYGELTNEPDRISSIYQVESGEIFFGTYNYVIISEDNMLSDQVYFNQTTFGNFKSMTQLSTGRFLFSNNTQIYYSDDYPVEPPEPPEKEFDGSSFNIKIEYPVIDYSWYQTNSDKVTPKCPANWEVDELTEFNRYKLYNDDEWKLQLNQGETTTIPFKSKNIENISTRKFIFNNVALNWVSYSIRVWFNETDFSELTFANGNEFYTMSVDIPNNTQYIKIEPIILEDTFFFIDANVTFEVQTASYEINTEQNNTSINLNNKASISVANTLNLTNLKERDVYYSNELILHPNEETQLNEIASLARYNKILMSVNIDNTEEAGNTLGNIGSGSLENIIKYWYIGHSRTQNTGIYSFIKLDYKFKKNNNIYI